VRQFDTTIGINDTVSPSWKVLGFSWPETLPAPQPGQFFTFRPQALEPGDSGLLRRPLAFAAFDGSAAYSVYQVKGSATKALSTMKKGDRLDVIAPLGNSFPLPLPDETACLLGGGIGIGPMLFLFSTLLKERGSSCPDTKFLLGFRSANFVPDFSGALSDEGKANQAVNRVGKSLSGIHTLADAVSRASIATDDGTCGYGGTILEALASERSASGEAGKPRHYYACGPAPMLAALHDVAEKEGAPAHVSVEQWMACGVGACHGCVLPSSRGGYLRACADGPVFASGEITWKK
jgi:dihydroorotate dehydrogenase electron transfer subunit